MEPITPTAACDSLHVSYKNCVVPIFASNCYVCHGSNAAANTMRLDSFPVLKEYLTIYYHNDSIYGSKFYHTINYAPGVLHMPPSAKMSAADIYTIKKWIDAGAPEN